jgi:hypothetical protein
MVDLIAVPAGEGEQIAQYDQQNRGAYVPVEEEHRAKNNDRGNVEFVVLALVGQRERIAHGKYDKKDNKSGNLQRVALAVAKHRCKIIRYGFVCYHTSGQRQKRNEAVD